MFRGTADAERPRVAAPPFVAGTRPFDIKQAIGIFQGMVANKRGDKAVSTARKPRRNAAANSPRRKELLRIAQEVIAEKSFRLTSVRDIADRADMLSGSLFYHFPTKASLAEALFTPVFDRIVEVTRDVASSDRPVQERIAELHRQTILVCAGEHRLAWVMLQDDWQYFVSNFDAVANAYDELTRIWTRLVDEGIDAGVVRNDVDPAILIHMMRSLLNDFVRWFDPAGAYSIKEVADSVVAVISTGIRGEMPPKSQPIAKPRKRARGAASRS